MEVEVHAQLILGLTPRYTYGPVCYLFLFYCIRSTSKKERITATATSYSIRASLAVSAQSA